MPPQLPPRPPSQTEPPPPYSDIASSQHPLLSLTSYDPRSSSTQSLVPEERTSQDSRRKLLLIYIHGFMGAETSFRSFPAHVHNLLAITLAESHVVHSKVYPRYQSRRHIRFATEDFSKWLAPHESPSTDIVLLGHSMGGLLSAEVVLLPAPSYATAQSLRHRILGTINFDVPFLGMHPGVIKSGLGSIFNPAPPPRDQPSSSQSPALSPQQSVASSSTGALSFDVLDPIISDSLGSPEPTDPNFNPTFPNDVHRPSRSGWNSMLHFAKKHKDDLLNATKQLVTSHLEFGGAMADFNGLKTRYTRIRVLEEEDETKRRAAVTLKPPPRVRFVNYYTASTGRPKKPKPQTGDGTQEEGKEPKHLEAEISDLNLSEIHAGSHSPSPRISVEEYHDGQVVTQKAADVDSPTKCEEEASTLAEDISFDDSKPTNDEISTTAPISDSFPYLPEIPPTPEEPAPLNLPPNLDKDTRKYAEQGHTTAVKSYKEAIRSRDKVIKEREKIQAKHARQLRKQEEARDKAARKEETKRLKQDKAGAKAKEQDAHQQRASGLQHEHGGSQLDAEIEAREAQLIEHEGATADLADVAPTSFSLDGASRELDPATTEKSNLEQQQEQDSLPAQKKPLRDRKFCILPSKTRNAAGETERDPTWVRVYMPGVDEVGAHCGLFFLGETYERLVGDVAGRIESWCRDAEGERVAREFAEGG